MPWGLIIVCVVVFVIINLCTRRDYKKTGMCPMGCHGCGRCTKMMEKMKEMKEMGIKEEAKTKKASGESIL
jgi:hypothetical protein